VSALAAAVALPDDLRRDLRVVAANPAAAGVDELITGTVDGAFALVREHDGHRRRCACPVTAVLLLRGVLPADVDLADHGQVTRLVLAWIAAQPAAAAVNEFIAAWDELVWLVEDGVTDRRQTELAAAAQLRAVLAQGAAA
jgi:hypothetical protein